MTDLTPRSIRILLLEDGDAAGRVRQNLSGAGLPAVLQRADALPAFERALREFSPDVVIVDAGLAQAEPARALQLAHARSPNLPVIFVECGARRGTARALFQAGAAGYLAHENLWRLGTAVRSALARARAARERQLATAAAEHLRLLACHLQQAAA